jgi:hypothetical protein
MVVWYSLRSFGIFFPFRYFGTKKNLATLLRPCKQGDERDQTYPRLAPTFHPDKNSFRKLFFVFTFSDGISNGGNSKKVAATILWGQCQKIQDSSKIGQVGPRVKNVFMWKTTLVLVKFSYYIGIRV